MSSLAFNRMIRSAWRAAAERGGRMTGRVTDNACRTWLGPQKSYRSAAGRLTPATLIGLYIFPFCTARRGQPMKILSVTRWKLQKSPKGIFNFFFLQRKLTWSFWCLHARRDPPEVVKVKHFKRLLRFSHHCRPVADSWSAVKPPESGSNGSHPSCTHLCLTYVSITWDGRVSIFLLR